MTNEQRVKTLFAEANPIPDADSFALDEIGGTAPPNLVTRVIGLPGETIEVRDGSVYVNDRILGEPYLKNPQILQLPFGPITLGADELWLMGDNRQTSGDSEFRGSIAISLLRGKITGIANP